MRFSEDSEEQRYIRRAFELAKLNAGKTAPNPWVGAVLVKDGKIIGEGFHLGAGFPHAEVEAINSAKRNGFSTEGAYMYVSLQPCNTYGRTPPCVDQIKKSGIKKVFFSVYDPNIVQKNYETGGLYIKGGILEKEGKKILLPYLVFTEKKRPYVIIKLAQTLDGKIADFSGKSKYITSEKSLELVHKLRAKSNAIIIGKETFVRDNPYLNTRNLKSSFLRKIETVKKSIGGDYPNPVKIVIDPDLSSLFHNQEMNLYQGNNVLFIGSADYEKKILSSEFQNAFRLNSRRNNLSFALIKSSDGGINLLDMMDFLYNLGIMVVVVEGGGRTAWEFFIRDLFDELWIFIAPKILGGGKSIGNNKPLNLYQSRSLKILSIRKTGEDILIRLSRELLWDVL